MGWRPHLRGDQVRVVSAGVEEDGDGTLSGAMAKRLFRCIPPTPSSMVRLPRASTPLCSCVPKTPPSSGSSSPPSPASPATSAHPRCATEPIRSRRHLQVHPHGPASLFMSSLSPRLDLLCHARTEVDDIGAIALPVRRRLHMEGSLWQRDGKVSKAAPCMLTLLHADVYAVDAVLNCWVDLKEVRIDEEEKEEERKMRMIVGP